MTVEQLVAVLNKMPKEKKVCIGINNQANEIVKHEIYVIVHDNSCVCLMKEEEK